jgi:hypothetical protein
MKLIDFSLTGFFYGKTSYKYNYEKSIKENINENKECTYY